MRRLFNKSLERQLQIVELIRKSEEHDAKDLLEIFDVDIKTITKDIKEINQIIYPLEVVRATSLEYYLKIPRAHNLDYIYSRFLAHSLEYQLLETILLEETYNYQELSEKLFISVSSLRRTVIRMNKVLSKKALKVETNPFRLVGEEIEVTNFLCFYLIEKYTITENFLNEFEQNILDVFIDTILTLKNVMLAYANKEMSKWIVITNIIRMRNGNQREKVLHPQPYEEILKIFQEMPLFLYKFKEVFKMELTLELLDQAGHVIFQPLFTTTVEELAYKRTINAEVDRKLTAIETIIDKLKEKVVLLSSNPKLTLRLFNLSVSYYGEIFILNDSDRTFLLEIEQKWPDFFNLLKEEYDKHTAVLEKEQFANFSFLLITEWPELTKYLSESQKNMKVGLFCTTAETHMRFISGELGRSLPGIFDFEILEVCDDEEIRAKKIDVIVTNINDLVRTRPTICVSKYVSTDDIEKLTYFYNNWEHKTEI